MNLTRSLAASVALLAGISGAAIGAPLSAASAGLPANPAAWKEYTYTITSVVKVLKPCDPATMTDPYQDVRVLSQNGDCYTLEITYYPLKDAVHAAREARYAHAAAVDAKRYLAPTATCNWDAKMRSDLVAQLKAEGIDPTAETGLTLIQDVARWAIHGSTYFGGDAPGMPTPWYVDYAGGKPAVYGPLRADFEAQKPTPRWTDQNLIDHEVLGKQMFNNKCHGACTSSSVYLATIFRALGIPARILYFIPACDGNDPKQVEKLTAAIHHNYIRGKVENGIGSGGGFNNHMYNEVFVDGRWVRLNYDNVDQGIVDENYFGLVAHIDTCRDIAETDLAQTWGMRSKLWPNVTERLTSVNPYMLVSATDHFGRYAHIENPPAPELTTVTINAVDYVGTPAFKALTPDSFMAQISENTRPDCMIEIAEYLPGQNYHQLRNFGGKAGRRFVFHAAGQADVHLTVTGLNCNIEGHQGFGARIDDADRDKIVSGVAYTIEPINTSPKYRWTVAPGVTVAANRAAHVDAPESTVATITAIDFAGTVPFTTFIPDRYLVQIPAQFRPDLIVEVQDDLPREGGKGMHNFHARAGQHFVLHATGRADIHVTVTDLTCGSDTRPGFGAQIDPADRDQVAPGVDYTIEPVNTSTKYRWSVQTGVVARKP